MSLLDTVIDQATWAFYAAYGKAGHGLDAPRGRALDPRDRGEDNVGRPGEIDLEVGDGCARAAYHAVCDLFSVPRYTSPARLARAARRVEPQRGELLRVAWLLEKAVGEPFTLPARCNTCLVRPPAMRRDKDGEWREHRGGECATCANWRDRYNGEQRPDRDGFTEARRAQVRRVGRGDSYGAA